MKANELMIGDLVRVNRDGLCIKKDTIVQVRGIDGDDKIEEKGLFGSAHCRPLDEEQFDGGIWLDYLDPIPLTPEILEKNGFMHFHPENKKAEYWQIYFKDGDINVKRTYGHFRFFITGKPIQKEAYRPTFNGHLIYVHELQHALRLCGIEKEIVL